MAKVLLQTTKPDILADICWALCNLCECDRENKFPHDLYHSGVLPALIKLMTHNNKQVLIPALRIVGNILTSEDEFTQLALNLGVLA